MFFVDLETAYEVSSWWVFCFFTNPVWRLQYCICNDTVLLASSGGSSPVVSDLVANMKELKVSRGEGKMCEIDGLLFTFSPKSGGKFGVESLLLHIERSKIKWFGHMIRMPLDASLWMYSGHIKPGGDPGHAGGIKYPIWPANTLEQQEDMVGEKGHLGHLACNVVTGPTTR